MSGIDLGAHRLVGDGEGCALVTPDGEIDFWCPDRVDGVPALWSLLDASGGRATWRGARLSGGGPAVLPGDDAVAGPALRSVLAVPAGRFECIDGLVSRSRQPPFLVRLVRALDGPLEVVHELALAPFGRGQQPELAVASTGRTGTEGGRRLDLLAGPAGSWQAMVMGRGPLPDGGPNRWLAQLAERSEAAACALSRARLPRSHPARAVDALRVIQACTWRPTGAVVASVTTSLPEAVPGDRQFDYRYCWLRDAALAVSVASLLGHHDGARSFLAFICEMLGDDPLGASPVMAVDGGAVPAERELDRIAGWAGQQPVRVGNQASGQVQHDALGLFVEAVSVHVQTGGHLDDAAWSAVRAIADAIAGLVLSGPAPPTSGQWEMRSSHRLLSEDVARWLALDRALWVARGWRPTTPRRSWRRARARLRQRIAAALGRHGTLPTAYDAELPGPDAAALGIALFGLVRGRRSRALVGHVVDRLGAGPWLYRYPPGRPGQPAWDGFLGREGAFLPASFQAVGSLASVGELAQARRRLDAMCARLPRLLAEMVDPRDGSGLGNVPLVWSHAELVRALYLLDVAERRRRLGPVGLGLWRLVRYLRLRRQASGAAQGQPPRAGPGRPPGPPATSR